VIIENRRGTFVAPEHKNLLGLQKALEDHFGLQASSCPLPEIRPNYPLRVPHAGRSKATARSTSRNVYAERERCGFSRDLMTLLLRVLFTPLLSCFRRHSCTDLMIYFHFRPNNSARARHAADDDSDSGAVRI
jgi:hypothetical protein